MVKIQSTLVVVNEQEIKAQSGVTEGQSLQPIVGNAERPTDRIRAALATYGPGTIERLHWHPIEAFYFVISGRATVRDFEGKEEVNFRLLPHLAYCPDLAKLLSIYCLKKVECLGFMKMDNGRQKVQ